MRFFYLSSLKNRYVLLRHGETNASEEKIYMGRLDHELNEKGKEQTSTVRLPLIPDCIFVSPLKRTTQTVINLFNYHRSSIVIEDNRLIEKSGGDIEGKTYSEIAKNYPNVWNIWKTKSLDYILKAKFPNGESDEEVIQRVESFFVEMEQSRQNKTILLVTHSGVIQAIRYLIGLTKDEIYLAPVEPCHIEVIG